MRASSMHGLMHHSPTVRGEECPLLCLLSPPECMVRCINVHAFSIEQSSHSLIKFQHKGMLITPKANIVFISGSRFPCLILFSDNLREADEQRECTLRYYDTVFLRQGIDTCSLRTTRYHLS